MHLWPSIAVVVACFALVHTFGLAFTPIHAFGLAFAPMLPRHPQDLGVVGICVMLVSSFRFFGAHRTQTALYNDGPTSAGDRTRPRHRTKHLAFAAIALASHDFFLGRVPQRSVCSNLFALASSAAIWTLSTLYLRNTAFFSRPRIHPFRPSKSSPEADPCGPFLWCVRCTT